MKHFLLSLSVLLLTVTPVFAQQTEVNILSYNVHNGIGMDKKVDYQRIADVILQTAPDIVAVQELDSVTTRNKGVYVLGELENLTKMHGIYASAIPFQGGSYGIGILSKEVPIKYEVIAMPGREEKRAMIIAEYKDSDILIPSPKIRSFRVSYIKLKCRIFGLLFLISSYYAVPITLISRSH